MVYDVSAFRSGLGRSWMIIRLTSTFVPPIAGLVGLMISRALGSAGPVVKSELYEEVTVKTSRCV